jgi:tripartite-type tricarboxylate transporter receptor subunit TctC
LKKISKLLLGLLVLVALVGYGQYQSTVQAMEGVPKKPITFVVPFAAGGNSDIPARIFAKYMSKYSQQKVKVVNIVGAGGRIGAKKVMKAKPDGSMIIMQPVGYPMQYALGVADFSYKDFEPIGQWLDSTLAIVVNADSKYKTLQDLVAAAKAKPQMVKMGSVTGTLPLFAIIEIEKQNRIQFNKVDLAGSSKAPELIGNRIDGYIDGFGAVKQYIDSGQFRCLGIISDREIVGYEKLATFKKLGYQNYEYLKQAFGLWAPKGTPRQTVKYINNLIKQAAHDQECIKALNALGYSPAYSTVADYTKFMQRTYAAFQEAAKVIIGK